MHAFQFQQLVIHAGKCQPQPCCQMEAEGASSTPVPHIRRTERGPAPGKVQFPKRARLGLLQRQTWQGTESSCSCLEAAAIIQYFAMLLYKSN